MVRPRQRVSIRRELPVDRHVQLPICIGVFLDVPVTRLSEARLQAWVPRILVRLPIVIGDDDLKTGTILPAIKTGLYATAFAVLLWFGGRREERHPDLVRIQRRV